MAETKLLERGNSREEDEEVSAREEGKRGVWRMGFPPCTNLVTATSPDQAPLDAPLQPLNVSQLRVRYMGRAPHTARLC